uniref:Uncharacterized protein n=1 Tax=Picea glauca TaxID=3330 RepID=A0A101LV99_PICGL|nr:hypothetical protein ABT39_MTgene2112 [Picea glauca]QHR86925.1 hypothetical protein Q903MT_gene932 [Picea sitchensis]
MVYIYGFRGFMVVYMVCLDEFDGPSLDGAVSSYAVSSSRSVYVLEFSLDS